MIKKFIIFPVFILLCILFVGCTKFNDLESNRIVSPKNRAMPIKGTWKITSIIKYDKNSLPVFNKNDVFLFDDNYAIFKNRKFTNINYRVRTVDLEKYILLNYRISNIDLPVHYDTANIVSVCDNDKAIYEFIIINPNKIAVINEKVLYYLTKSKGIEKNKPLLKSASQSNNQSKEKKSYIEKNNILKSGALFGIRTAAGNYKTIWLEVVQDKIKNVTQCNNILLPRFNGFWLVGSESLKSYSNPYKYIFTNPINSVATSRNANINMYSHLKIDTTGIITFIGNDYMVLDENHNTKVLSIDNLEAPPTKISDLLGDMGKKVMMSSYKKFLNEAPSINHKEDIKLKNISPDERSFELLRKNGHWNLTGRVSYTDKNYNLNYVNYEINAAPPEKMVKYDDLKISFNQIKEKVPKAIDAYTSPNNDVAVIVTPDEMEVFKIGDGAIKGNSIYKIPMQPKDSIIMAEWARQDYVDMWAQYTSQFKK